MDVLEAYFRGLASVRPWLQALGAVTQAVPELPHCWPNFPGAASVTHYQVAGSQGAGLAFWSVLEEALGERAVDIRTSTALTGLRLRAGRVNGADVRTADGTVDQVSAQLGVVLATGGFEASRELTDTYLPVPALVPVGILANTGDGLVPAQAAGAALWHMSAFFGFWAFQAPGEAVAYPILPFGRSWLLVDLSGRRFTGEVGREPHDLLRPLGDVLPSRDRIPSLPVTLHL